jgi:hypothetical protein
MVDVRQHRFAVAHLDRCGEPALLHEVLARGALGEIASGFIVQISCPKVTDPPASICLSRRPGPACAPAPISVFVIQFLCRMKGYGLSSGWRRLEGRRQQIGAVME